MMRLSARNEQIQSVAYSPDGQLLASSSMSSVNVWRVSDGSLARHLEVPSGWANSLRFSNRGNRLAVISGDGSVIVWQVGEGPEGKWRNLGQLPTSNDGEASMLDFMPDGLQVVIGEPSIANPPSQVTLWRVSEPQPGLRIPIRQASLTTLRLSPDGLLLACGLSNGTIQVWQMPEGKLLQTLKSGSGGTASLVFSADGQMLISAWGGTIDLWKLQN